MPSMSFTEGDTRENTAFREYASHLFGSPPDALVFLPKTPPWFHSNLKDAEAVFVLTDHCRASDPSGDSAQLTIRTYDQYDGLEQQSRLFWKLLDATDGACLVVDPTCETGFAEACCTATSTGEHHAESVPSREGHPWFIWREDAQQEFLQTFARQIKASSAVTQRRKAIIVCLSKCDQWGHLIAEDQLPSPWCVKDSGTASECLILNADIVEAVSQRCRQLLVEHAPRLLAVLNGLQQVCDIFFVPVSATGSGIAGTQDSWSHRAGDIKPFWVEVPLLLAIAHSGFPKFTITAR